MKFFRFFLLFFIPVTVIGQVKKSDCGCPKSIYSVTKADTIFNLNHNISIALCGSEEKKLIKGRVFFSEFVLSICGSNQIIKFWGALTICKIKTVGDTLLVESVENLPVGKGMKYRYSIWNMERIYFKNGNVFRDSAINRHLPKYTPYQIAEVLKLYKHLPNANNNNTIDLVDKLFVSALSGSKKAVNYLLNFNQKFSLLDGAYAEDYDGKIRMLKEWQMQENRNPQQNL